MEQDRIIVVVEKEDGQIAPFTFELLKAGKELAGKDGETLCGCILGNEISDLSNEIAYYTDEVFILDNALLADFQTDLYASALAKLCQAIKPNTVLIGHAYDNLELAPKLAGKLRKELVTDCIHIEREAKNGYLLCTKPIYGGNAVAVLQLEEKPQIITLRPKVMDALVRGNKKGKLVPFECGLDPSVAQTQSLALVPEDSVILDKADAIVAGGRGIKATKGIELLYELVKALQRNFDKVEMGASRPLIDNGMMTHSHQIGQTGEKVSPQVYMAVAISGAVQHMAGAVGSRKIIAINKDEEAAIFDSSDYGVVGQYEDIVPALIEKIKEL